MIFSDLSLILKLFMLLNILVSAVLMIGTPLLYFFAIIRKKYVIKAQLLSWKHDPYASEITCDIGITNLAQPPFLVKKIYIRPAFSCSAFSKKKYAGTIESDNENHQFPLSFSVLEKKKVTLSFPVDISQCYDEINESKQAKQWQLILKTNRLARSFKIDAPF